MTDTINIPPYKDNGPGKMTMHPALQFLLIITILVIALIIGTLVGLGIVMLAFGMDTMKAITTVDTSVPHFTTALWIVQFTGTTFPILATPVFFATVVMKDRMNYLRTSFRFPPQLLLIVFAIMLFSFPVIELLSNINQKLPVPHFLKWMADNQKTEEKLMSAMMDMKSIWNVIFEKWTKNMHAAIWVTAILFSAFHMDFYGFLPRVMLGALFGYFVAWSGSIWTSVWAHFVNNGTIVVLTYLYQNSHTKISPDDTHVFNYTAYIISTVIILFFFWIYRRMALGQKPLLQ